MLQFSTMSPPPLRSALSDYGFITCTQYKTCYNQVCPPCTIFNAASKVCEPPTESDRIRRGLEVCSVSNSEAPTDVKQQWAAVAMRESAQRLNFLRNNPNILNAGVVRPQGNLAAGRA